MAGSGIEEVLELVYAKNAVPHILSGKAVARAIRGHFLVDAALNAMLVSDTFSLPLSATLDEANTEEEPVVPQPSIDEDLESAKVLYNRLKKSRCQCRSMFIRSSRSNCKKARRKEAINVE